MRNTVTAPAAATAAEAAAFVPAVHREEIAIEVTGVAGAVVAIAEADPPEARAASSNFESQR